jgi:hypothetical protein
MPAEEKVRTFRPARAVSKARIVVGDRSLEEWPQGTVLTQITASKAGRQQWEDIRGRTPESLLPGDFALTLHSAVDSEFWYLAIDVTDDRILLGGTSHPYSGDCFELFVAGAELDSDEDMATHVKQARRTTRSAFFQLVIPPEVLSQPGDYLPPYRTDAAFAARAGRQLQAAAWEVEGGWRAEVRIPLAAFDEEVRGRLGKGLPLKFSFDYLDYDRRTARRDPADDWGFRPDNVFSLCKHERQVNVPRYMDDLSLVGSSVNPPQPISEAQTVK